jgi:hypothetical protein
MRLSGGTAKNSMKNGRIYETTGISPQRTQRSNVSYKNSVSSVVKFPQKKQIKRQRYREVENRLGGRG